MIAAALLAVATAAQAPAASLGKTVTAEFDVPADLEVKVWAESPQLLNPTNIDVDARGRIWATEGIDYRIKIRKSVPGDGYLRHDKGDRVVIVEDSDGDGVADKSKVFVEDPELISPLGIAVIGNKVIVSSSPGVFVYTDRTATTRRTGRRSCSRASAAWTTITACTPSPSAPTAAGTSTPATTARTR